MNHKIKTCIFYLLWGLALLAGITLAAGMLFQGVLLKETEDSSCTAGSSFRLMDRYDDYVSGLSGEEVQVEEKVYWLSDNDLVAPEPDAACYGEVAAPGEMKVVVQKAAKLLDGQAMYFSENTVLCPDSTIRYYLDDTIFAVTWKEVHHDCVYTFSEVKIAHPSQFRRFLAGGEYGSNKQFYSSEMAASVNAVVASSGDFYGYRHFGTRVYNGKAYAVDRTNLHICFIDENGDMKFAYPGEHPNVETLQQYVDENHVRFSLAFGPVLVENGQQRELGKYYLGEVLGNYSRAGLCQMGNCHYLLCTANYEGEYRSTPNMITFSQVLTDTGCQQAYALDGGQTATLVMNDEVINSVSYGSQRKISDIIYFATAIP